MRLLMVVSFIFSLQGCAGTPLHTKSLSPEELTRVDLKTLCSAATNREFYRPNEAILNEVRRRNVNCSSVYQYGGQNLQMMQMGSQLMSGSAATSAGPTYGGSATGPAFLKSEKIVGMNKVCSYDRMGSAYETTVRSTELCPQTLGAGTSNTTSTSGGAATGPALYKSEKIVGLNKVCNYDRMGSAYVVTIRSTDLCPLNP